MFYLLPNVEAEAMLGDKAYDADARVIKVLEERGIAPVIPSSLFAAKTYLYLSVNLQKTLYPSPQPPILNDSAEVSSLSAP